MNHAQKGKRIERELQLIFENKGFWTHKATSNRFNRNDLWGCFDLMLKNPASPDYTVYIQSSTQWKSGKALLELEDFPQGSMDLLFMSRKKNRQDFEFKMKYGKGDWRIIPIEGILRMVA